MENSSEPFVPPDKGKNDPANNIMMVDDPSPSISGSQLSSNKKRPLIDNHPNSDVNSKKKIISMSRDNVEEPLKLAPRAVFTYESFHSGPFSVIIQPAAPTENSRIQDVIIGKLLIHSYRNDIVDIKQSGRAKVTVTLNSAAKANKLVKDPILPGKNLSAFIPKQCATRLGIVKGVPLDLDENEISTHAESKYKILEAKRFSRKSNNENGESIRIPTRTILLTFSGQTRPPYIAIYKVKYAVEEYVPQVR